MSRYAADRKSAREYVLIIVGHARKYRLLVCGRHSRLHRYQQLWDIWTILGFVWDGRIILQHVFLLGNRNYRCTCNCWDRRIHCDLWSRNAIPQATSLTGNITESQVTQSSQ